MPEGFSLIGVLFVAGFLLVAAEVFVPGLVVGTLGFLCLAASVGLVFYHYGALPGVVAAIIVGAASIGSLMVWLNVFPKTFIGRRIILSRRQSSGRAAVAARVGEEGLSLTALRPSGTACIGGKRVDVTAVGEFLEEGTRITVVAADGLRVAVRRKDGLEAAAPSV